MGDVDFLFQLTDLSQHLCEEEGHVHHTRRTQLEVSHRVHCQ